jgi:futalosine hydrolase
MAGRLSQFAGKKAVLMVVAAPSEAAAVRAGIRGVAGANRRETEEKDTKWQVEELGHGFDLLETGVGKVNAAAATVLAVSSGRHAAVVNVGICGALVPLNELPLGSVVVADRCAYADEGVQTPDGFRGLGQLGFPLGPFDGESIPTHSGLRALVGTMGRVGGIATVSTCSGTDALAAAVALRTGAIAEAMEGAAIAHVLARAHPGLAFAEIRVVSNSTGDRSRQKWDIKGALERLRLVVSELAGA